ncbi:MAG: ABC transporter ATP-binding protein [Candidatus Riflebacteria bacterium HGW-Riflebacteria-1]|jgi:ABC-type Mn2+/Zn2+ transport system ATPase subunit|nr:MAG: ABC transporter ATP-binding protein [Candidatus Riflebacteria bacterium HGW-Riflebacteria-1]
MSDWFSSRELSVGYNRQKVLENLTCHITTGETIGLVGANGSGKTTLLKTMLGLIPPLAGEMSTARDKIVAYIPQAHEVDELFPFTLREIIEMGASAELKPWQAPGSAISDKVDAALLQTGLIEKAEWLFSNLSGGQKQRAILAQALVRRPDVMILDEPTRGLDIVQTQHFLSTLEQLRQRNGLTMIFVSHILEDIVGIAGRIFMLSDCRMQILSELNADSIVAFKKHLIAVAENKNYE